MGARGWRDKNRKKLWIALGMSALVIAFLVILMRPYFETNDDIAISEFVNGARGAYDAHLVYQNYVLGLILKCLYQISGSLPWYTIIQYALLLISLISVTWVLLNIMRGFLGWGTALLLLLYFGYECFIRIQYTKTAGILTAAGLFLIVYTLSLDRVSVGLWFLGLILTGFGFMYRSAQFFACAVLMAVTGFSLLAGLPGGKREKGYVRKMGRLLAGAVLSLILPVLVLGMADRTAYRTDPVWRDYVEYNRLRTELLDYGFPDEAENRELYGELDLNEEALYLYRNWNFNDPDKFSKAVMQRLIEAKSGRTLNLSVLKQFLKEVPRIFLGTEVFRCFLVLFLIWMAAALGGRHRRRLLLVGSCEIVLFGLLYFYMFYTGRYGMNRVDVGLWFSAGLAFAWYLAGEKGAETRLFSGILLAAGILSAMMLVVERREDWRVHTHGRIAAMKSSREVYEQAGSDKEHLYIAKVGALSAAACYGPFDQMPFGVMDNICLLGGWPTNSAPCLETQQRYGVTNPYRNMIGNTAVYLADSDIGLTMDYIHTYYDESAQAVEVGVLGNDTIYQIR